MKRVAIVLLACSDYESLEVSLACHAAYLPAQADLFVLQNCRGTYDAERSLAVGQRYARLFPGRIHVVTGNKPAKPYRAIAALLATRHLAAFDLVCKVDDDSFPIAPGWLDALVRGHAAAEAAGGPALAYVTPLINNNCWGFAETLQVMGLGSAFAAEMARDHWVGTRAQRRIAPAGEIDRGGHGTIWQAPHLARWLHARTTLVPDRFIAATQGLSDVPVPGSERYSINCMLFRPALWRRIDDGSGEDEHMLHQHCLRTGERILCVRSVPFVHIAYFPQREENRDLVADIRRVYEARLGHPFPVAMRASRELEIEARLRWMEEAIRNPAKPR